MTPQQIRRLWTILTVAVIFIGVLLLLAGIDALGAPTGPNAVTISATPQQVNRYDYFTITISTTAPYTPYNLTISGKNGFYQETAGATDDHGIHVENMSASWDYGQYELDALITNGTARTFVTVGCDTACITTILEQNGVEGQQMIYAILTQSTVYLLVGLLAFELPRQVAYFRRLAKIARDHGGFTPRESAAAPFVLMRGHFNPGDNVADPKNPQNPRIQVDAQRRQLMEQLHDATGRAYLEWRPDHMDNIEDVVRDLRRVWAREREIIPEAILTAKAWERKMKSLGPTLETAGRSAPIEAPKPRSELNRRVPADVRGIPPPPNGRNEMRPIESRRRRRVSGMKVSLVAFGVLGLPSAIMAVLVRLAYSGIYIEPLRSLATSWPSDSWKLIIGWTVFSVTIVWVIRERAKLKAWEL